VVAIIGILAALALPQYQAYSLRSKFTEVIAASSAAKLAVELCAQDQGGLTNCYGGTNGVPADLIATPPARVSHYVQSVRTQAQGIIMVQPVVGNGFAGTETFQLTPTYGGRQTPLQWTIGGGCVPLNLC